MLNLEEYLKSIGGLENGYYTDRPPITDVGFFQVGKGWYPLIQKLIEDLIELGWNKQVYQVKEKFGGLRFYINTGTEEIHQRIRKAEDESYETCETCGEPGELRKGGWWTVACDKHIPNNEG